MKKMCSSQSYIEVDYEAHARFEMMFRDDIASRLPGISTWIHGTRIDEKGNNI
jgi:hypothetical protein